MKLDIQIKGNKIYSPILEKMLPLTPEEEIRQNFICDLINLHGYKLEQMGQELIKSIGNDYVDIVIWKTAIDKQNKEKPSIIIAVSYTHLRAHETRHDLVCRLLLEKKKSK